MKFKNVALPKTQKSKLERVKCCLWHGNAEKALDKLDTLIDNVKNVSRKMKLTKLKTYIKNNQAFIVNYDERENAKLPYTSHLAESTVERLINQRCKGYQHMRWSRSGVHKLLQVRAYIDGNNWSANWLDKIIGTVLKNV